MKYIIVLLGGFLLFFLFQGLRFLSKKIFSNKDYFRNIWTVLNIAEFIIWIVFVFWSLDRLLAGKSYYQYIVIAELIILISLLGYYFINDLVAGAIFKIQHHPEKGKYYDFKKYAGKIKKVGTTGLLLETNDGQDLDVPFSEIKGPVYERKELKSKSNISISLKVEKKEPKDVIFEKIRQTILISAYSSQKTDPEIKVVKEDDIFMYLDVIINTLNSKHQALLERKLNEEFTS